MASEDNSILKFPPKALSFDVFGTVVDWRKSVTAKLMDSAASKISIALSSKDTSDRDDGRMLKLEEQDWNVFAQDWRNTYKQFTRNFVPGETEWRDIDTHHYLSLIDLLKERELDGIYTDAEVKDISLIWHFLDPWEDSSSGIRKLGSTFITCTLSNGNISLLEDLNKHGDLCFKKLQSSANFKAYKPHPSTYQGAAKAMDLATSEVAMVAAHLNDLKAARSCGFKTIYIERKREEDWKTDSEEYRDAKSFVDMWVKEGEGGLLEVARRFGCE
ncbi:haloacid dehalogenase [Calycina marina]|uniref:Haloacid dehalogenase n=1 Tax=Calycina marina TaxID=1763456 RepID=A0A9P7Z486_9HELO|nr:haloacid dehalogenase [Calycina marina]